jgi:hypothetical protein
MGGDQLEAYKLALDFYNYPGNVQNFISNSNLLNLNLRLFWASIDFIFVKLFPSNISLAFCTLLPAFLGWIAFFQTYNYANTYFLNKYKALAFSLLVFFGSCLIVGFNGISLEAMFFVLFLKRIFLFSKVIKNKYLIYFLIDASIIAFKPYYAVIPIILNYSEFGFLNKKNYKLYVALFFSFFPWLIIQGLISPESSTFFLNAASHTSLTDYFLNLYNFNFSFGMGLLWNFFILIFLISFGITNKKIFLHKLVCVVGIELILAFLPYWHGGLTGNRYFLPVIAIWIPEMLRGFEKLCYVVSNSKSLQVRAFFTYSLAIFVILHLPIIEYKNTSVYEYQNSTVFKNIPVGVIEHKNNYFPVNDVLFNPVIFSNRILYHNIFSFESINLLSGAPNTKLSDIYPNTMFMRIYFVSKNIDNLPYIEKVFPNDLIRNINFVGNLSKLLIMLFYVLVIFIEIYALNRLHK